MTPEQRKAAKRELGRVSSKGILKEHLAKALKQIDDDEMLFREMEQYTANLSRWLELERPAMTLPEKAVVWKIGVEAQAALRARLGEG